MGKCVHLISSHRRLKKTMKNSKMLLVASAITIAAASQAVIFTDPTGDVNVPGSPWPHLDITSVEVTNTDTSISFKYTVNGDLVATNWGKHLVVIRRAGAVDNTGYTLPDAWNRRASLSGGGNAFIGSWVDAPSNNQQNWTFDGTTWNQINTVSNNIQGPNMVTLTASLADLGITLGETITFDVFTTGGGGSPGNPGDTAVDSLTGASPTAWDQDITLQGLTYNVEAVPEPATMVVLGVAAAAALRRRKK
ncbi:hypothetical protein C0431_02150 [bacterium]|nr:hypothetical protein [bacterium]